MNNISKIYIPCILVLLHISTLLHANNIGTTDIKPVVCYFKGSELSNELELELSDNARATDSNGAEWALTIKKSIVQSQSDATDYMLTWTLVKGEVSEAAVAVRFPFKVWSEKNFVFVPAIVYDGNRFDVKHIDYPPYWYDKSEWRIDMPTTTTPQPSLGKGDRHERIELTTGNASTPLMAFHSVKQQAGWMVQTTQGSWLGNHGLSIEENDSRTQATFSITAPAVRKGKDTAPNWKTGDTVSIHFRVYSFKAPKLQQMMNRFMEVRKDINQSKRKEVLPYSEVWALEDHLFQTRRWDENIHMYWLSDVGANTSWNFIWQLGWCGGGQVTLPFILDGNAMVQQRALKNLEAIFSRSQAPSGLFNAYGNGFEFVGFGYFKPLENNETFVRSQGDWLYMAQRQFYAIEKKGQEVPSHWKSGLQKQADAFVKIWNTYGQFGQFVNVNTGEICIGGSTAGAIVSGGLALASQTYHSAKYLEVAEKSARKFYNDFVLKGYTTGGPGEILSTPDSESAFGLFESFITLYEVTKNKEWLNYASDLLPICASWTVSYDFSFPENSIMAQINAHSCGSVWASVANKHASPSICTWSGDSFLKYYRATSDTRAIDLLTDIAHGLPQYISREDRPVGKMPPGGICERVNLSDWEGKNGVGNSIFGSCSWCETSTLLTVTQLPGIYVQPDKGLVAVFDNVHVEKKDSSKGKTTLQITNPTKFKANVRILSESSKEAKKSLLNLSGNITSVSLDAGETKEIICN